MHFTLLVSLHVWTGMWGEQRKGGETYAQGNKQCFIGRGIYNKRAAQVLILNHADAFVVFNIVLKLIRK